MKIREEIQELIKNVLEQSAVEIEGEIKVTHPDFLEHGDFTFNVLPFAKKSGVNPREFAEQIRASIEQDLPKNIEKIEMAGAGFLNFFLSKEFYKDFLENFSFDEKKGEKILLEHTSTNLFKPFHIGHLVNNSLGESIGRILKFSGNEVEVISFPSDVSPGIAKTIWALKKQKISLDSLTLKEISDAYVFGSFEYKNNQEVREEANKINIEIYNFLENDNSRESENTKFYERGKALSMDHFEEITKKLGSFFSEKIFESETERVGREIVKKNIPNVFKDSEGAVIFEGKNFTNVFINSDNFGTYLAKDIGLLKVKSQKFSDVKHSLVVTDIEQKQHFEMLKEAGAKISDISDFTEKSKYLQHGRMSFAGSEKISSRFGNVPLATELIDMVKKKILEKMKDRDFTNEEKEGISQKLAIANLKYSILKVTSGKNISFDMEKDLNPQGNTATFLLYSFVRARSILSKADLSIDSLRERKEDISSLEKRMYRFSEEVEKSLKDYSPHHLANFLYDLAKEFNSFYTNTKILDEKNSDYFYNLKILNKFSQTMKKGLELLGIETVEKM